MTIKVVLVLQVYGTNRSFPVWRGKMSSVPREGDPITPDSDMGTLKVQKACWDLGAGEVELSANINENEEEDWKRVAEDNGIDLDDSYPEWD